MINNGSMHYDHDRDGTHTMIGGCEVKFRNFAHDTYLNIRYENDVLTGSIYFFKLKIDFYIFFPLLIAVTHDLDNKRAWSPCLRVEGVKLPTGYYFGASAATGIKWQQLILHIIAKLLKTDFYVHRSMSYIFDCR